MHECHYTIFFREYKFQWHTLEVRFHQWYTRGEGEGKGCGFKMEVRKLTENEHFEANVISYVAFHSRVEDLEKAREESWKLAIEDWGAFADDGRMMARVLNYRFDTFLDGKTVVSGGIGGVSTLPEYRDSGAIRRIFGQLLPAAYRNGEVISTLYPFNHAFYRKFGYETACWRHDYECSPAVLRDYRFDGTVVPWQPGDPVGDYTALYNRFAASFNLAMRRDDQMMGKHLKGEPLKDRKFAYLLREQGKPVAYLIFQDIRHDPAAILSVEDWAWDGRTGMNALLGFLARFSADYGSVRLFLPASLQLFSFIRSPQAYEIQQNVRQGYMIRPINVQKLLEAIRKPVGCRFVIRVEGDPYIAENNGAWEVTEGGAAPTDRAPDMTVSIQALGQMAAGCVSLAEARYRPDVAVAGNEETLSKVFVRKPVFVEDHF